MTYTHPSEWLEEQVATGSNSTKEVLHPASPDTQLELRYGLADLRRAEVVKYLARGLNQLEISRMLNVDKSTISRDVQLITQKAKQEIKSYITEHLPLQYAVLLQGVDDLIRQEWIIMGKSSTDVRTQQRAIEGIKELYALKTELLGDAPLLEEGFAAVARIKKLVGLEDESQ
jgi:hypothetical protein